MNTSAQSKNGAALVVVALSMVAASLIGAAILAKATGSRYERVQFGIANRAYYLAESGPAYVRARSDADPEFGYPPMHVGHPPYTNVFANGDQFIVTAYRTNIQVVTTNAGSPTSPVRSTPSGSRSASPGPARCWRRGGTSFST